MQTRFRILLMTILLIIGLVIVVAQDVPGTLPECKAENLIISQQQLQEMIPLDSEDAEGSLKNLFQLGRLYQDLALHCGYSPSEEEVEAMVEQVSQYVDAATLLNASSVGYDVNAVMSELEDVIGDPINGQLLYNGLEVGIDGAPLGCSGCHLGVVAPFTEGTYTRIDEIRLADPALADYTVRQYLVESILIPNAYTPPDYLSGLMPTFFGDRLDIQQLADLILYLESQDQELPEAQE